MRSPSQVRVVLRRCRILTGPDTCNVAEVVFSLHGDSKEKCLGPAIRGNTTGSKIHFLHFWELYSFEIVLKNVVEPSKEYKTFLLTCDAGNRARLFFTQPTNGWNT